MGSYGVNLYGILIQKENLNDELFFRLISDMIKGYINCFGFRGKNGAIIAVLQIFFFNQYNTDKILSLSVLAKFRVLASVSIVTSTLKRVDDDRTCYILTSSAIITTKTRNTFTFWMPLWPFLIQHNLLVTNISCLEVSRTSYFLLSCSPKHKLC